MFTEKMIADIIKSDISIIPGICETKNDILVEGGLIIISIKISNDVNVFETAKKTVELIRYKLIDKTDNNNFKIRLIIKK